MHFGDWMPRENGEVGRSAEERGECRRYTRLHRSRYLRYAEYGCAPYGFVFPYYDATAWSSTAVGVSGSRDGHFSRGDAQPLPTRGRRLRGGDQEKIKQSPAGVRSQSIEDSVFFGIVFEKQTDIQVLAQSSGSGSPAGTRTAIVRYKPEQGEPKRGDPKSNVDGTGGSRQDRGEGKRRLASCKLRDSRTRTASE